MKTTILSLAAAILSVFISACSTPTAPTATTLLDTKIQSIEAKQTAKKHRSPLQKTAKNTSHAVKPVPRRIIKVTPDHSFNPPSKLTNDPFSGANGEC